MVVGEGHLEGLAAGEHGGVVSIRGREMIAIILQLLIASSSNSNNNDNNTNYDSSNNSSSSSSSSSSRSNYNSNNNRSIIKNTVTNSNKNKNRNSLDRTKNLHGILLRCGVAALPPFQFAGSCQAPNPLGWNTASPLGEGGDGQRSRDKEESEEDRTILDPGLSRIMPCCEGSCSSGPAVREEPEGNEDTTEDGRTTL